jgi:type IV secretory pathway VirB10-like protein
MGCDDVMDYIDEVEQTRPQSEPQLNKSLESPSKKAKKKKKKPKTKDQRQQISPRKEKVAGKKQAEKKPPSARSSKAKATITMETLPEEVLVSTSQSMSERSRGLARSLSPKRSHRFSKLMVVADGSLRRAVDRKKGSFWEQQSVKRRGSVRQSIHNALGEALEIDESYHLFDEDNSKLELESKTGERSVSTEITDPWNNSWSVSSDSFHDNSERLRNSSLLLSKSPEVEHIKRITPF